MAVFAVNPCGEMCERPEAGRSLSLGGCEFGSSAFGVLLVCSALRRNAVQKVDRRKESNMNHLRMTRDASAILLFGSFVATMHGFEVDLAECDWPDAILHQWAQGQGSSSGAAQTACINDKDSIIASQCLDACTECHGDWGGGSESGWHFTENGDCQICYEESPNNWLCGGEIACECS